jgi:uncharacterized protein
VVGQLGAVLDAGVTLAVAQLWRYPVKSLGGERLDRAQVGEHGVEGDRQWALFDVATGFGLTARRVPELLLAGARCTGDGVEVLLPDGTVTADDAVLSDWLGRPVVLRPASATEGRPRYESPDDDQAAAEGPVPGWYPWRGAAGAFHDDPDARVSLVSTGTLGGWDARRFRANVVLDGAGEEALVGRRVRCGAAGLRLTAPIPRCVMVTRPQAGGLPRDTAVLKTVHRERGGVLAVGALVERAGAVVAGDALTVLD